MVIFSPPITELLDTANDVYQERADVKELREALKQARVFHGKSKACFTFFNKSMPENDELFRLTETFYKYCKKLEEEFDKMEVFINTGNIETLAQASMGIQETCALITETNNALKKEKEKFEIFSPMRVIDDFIKIGINVENGLLDKMALKEKITFPIVLKENISEDCRKFEECYPAAEELNNNLKQSLLTMEQGIGMIYLYLENEEEEHLVNGLNILGVASQDICMYLDEMGNYRAENGYSPNPYLDEFFCYFHKFLDSDISIERFKEALSEFKDYYSAVNKELLNFSTKFMIRSYIRKEFIPELGEHLEEINNLIEEVEENISEEDFDEKYMESMLEKIKLAFEEFQETKEEFFEESQREKDLSGNMEISNLRNIIKGLHEKVVTVSVLQEALVAHIRRNEALSSAVEKCLSIEEIPRLLAIDKALTIQKDALDELEEYISDKKVEHLFTALENIEKTFDSLTGVEQELAEMEFEENMVSCVKCAHMNPKGARKCNKCGFMLPYVGIDATQSSVEVVDEKELPLNKSRQELDTDDDIQQLKDLTDKVLQGLSGPDDLQKFLLEIRNKITAARKQFMNFAKPIKEKPTDTELKTKADELSLIFDHLDEATMYMNSYFTEEADEEFLKSGLETVLEYSKKLTDFQKSVQEILAKRKPDEK